MVEIQIGYKGELHCEAIHGPSRALLATDAPVDNHGRGESFSPTDLVATALGSCMATIMGIVANKEGVSLEGLSLKVGKEMSKDLPRRIVALPVEIDMPMAADHPAAELLQKAALGCPVNASIHPDIVVSLIWRWA